jgi:hypothetical protein
LKARLDLQNQSNQKFEVYPTPVLGRKSGDLENHCANKYEQPYKGPYLIAYASK